MANFLRFAVVSVFFAVTIVFNLIIVSRGCTKLVFKSYRPVVATVISLGGWFAIAVPLLWLDVFRMPRPPLSFADNVLFYGELFCSFTLAAFAILLLSKMLPKRVHRSGPSPRRWIHWRITVLFERWAPWMGGTLILTGLAGLWLFHTKRIALRLIINGITMLSIKKTFDYVRQVEKAPTASELMRADPRAATIYIRVFRQEHDYFTYGPKEVIERYIPNEVSIRSSAYMQVTIEQYLGPSFSKHIGPFIGLGNPSDYNLRGGAARDYEPDQGWQEFFLRYAEGANAIVMRPTVSGSLEWEIRQIVARHWQSKLFVVQRPLPKSRGRVIRWLFRGISWAGCIQRGTWEEFAREMRLFGLKIQGDDPGPGAVITFGKAGESVCLVSGAEEPDDFVLPVVAWLKTAAQGSQAFFDDSILTRKAMVQEVGDGA